MRHKRWLRNQALALLVLILLSLPGCSNGVPAPVAATTSTPVTIAAAAAPPLVTAPPVATALPTERPLATPTVAAGAKTPPAATQSPPLRSGWILYERPDEGFAIELPDSWTQIDLDKDNVQTIIDQLGKTNPELGEKLGKLLPSTVASNIKFWAFDFTRPVVDTGEVATINVIQQPVAIPVPLDSLATMSISMLRSTYGDKVSKEITKEALHTPYGEEMLISYTLQVNIQTGATLYRPVTQALMTDKKHLYVLSMVSSRSTSESYAPVFRAIAESLRILK